MNIQLKENATYTNPENNCDYNQGFGRIRNLGFAIISGEMNDPENFRAQAQALIYFYANKTAALEGKQPVYHIDLMFKDAELINLLTITEDGYSISEKKIYDYFLGLDGNSELFEYVV